MGGDSEKNPDTKLLVSNHLGKVSAEETDIGEVNCLFFV